MRKSLVTIAAVLALLGAPRLASAGVGVSIGIGLPFPGVVYAPPPPVVYGPPVAYGPPPVVYGAPLAYGGFYGSRRVFGRPYPVRYWPGRYYGRPYRRW